MPHFTNTKTQHRAIAKKGVAADDQQNEKRHHITRELPLSPSSIVAPSKPPASAPPSTRYTKRVSEPMAVRARSREPQQDDSSADHGSLGSLQQTKAPSCV